MIKIGPGAQGVESRKACGHRAFSGIHTARPTISHTHMSNKDTQEQNPENKCSFRSRTMHPAGTKPAHSFASESSEGRDAQPVGTKPAHSFASGSSGGRIVQPVGTKPALSFA